MVWRRLALFTATLVLGGSLLGGPAVGVAHAGTTGATLVVNGQGNISPGLTVLPTYEYWNFNGTASVTGSVNGTAVVAVPSDCGASGGSAVPETYAYGLGTGNWSCYSGPLAGRSGGLVYIRAGSLVHVFLTGGLIGELDCLFQSDQVPPAATTSYHLTCVGDVASV